MDANGHSSRQVRLTEGKPALRLRSGWHERFRPRVAIAVMVALWLAFLLGMVWWAMSGRVSIWPVQG